MVSGCRRFFRLQSGSTIYTEYIFTFQIWPFKIKSHKKWHVLTVNKKKKEKKIPVDYYSHAAIIILRGSSAPDSKGVFFHWGLYTKAFLAYYLHFLTFTSSGNMLSSHQILTTSYKPICCWITDCGMQHETHLDQRLSRSFFLSWGKSNAPSPFFYSNRSTPHRGLFWLQQWHIFRHWLKKKSIYNLDDLSSPSFLHKIRIQNSRWPPFCN